jgi:DNA-binding MarR family transcriptional regulator
MKDVGEELFQALNDLMRVKNECSCSILSECGVSSLTVRQIAYLKTIDGQEVVTFSRLAEITNNSKPTITEMVNRFEQMECVSRERSPDDGRVLFIRLTEKGRRIAHAEQAALRQIVKRILDSLDENEQELLIRLLEKVE